MNTFLTRIRLMRTVLLLLLPIVMQQRLSSQSLRQFSEQITLDREGNALVVWNVVPANDSMRTLLLPWNFHIKNERDESFAVTPVDSSSPACSARLMCREGNYFVRIDAPGAVGVRAFQISFAVPQYFDFAKEKIADFGNYTIKKRYINTTLSAIGDFSSTLVLPRGYVITDVGETIPKQAEDNPVSPYSVERVNGSNSVVLRVQKMKLGEHAFIKVQVKSDAKSPVLFYSLSMISILYLVFFRDLVRTKADAPVNEKPSV